MCEICGFVSGHHPQCPSKPCAHPDQLCVVQPRASSPDKVVSRCLLCQAMVTTEAGVTTVEVTS